MATKTATKTTRKTTAKKTPARKAPAKTPAKTKDAAKTDERAAANEALTDRIVELREGGASWAEVAKAVGANIVRVQDLYKIRTTPRADVAPTPARIKKDRDAGMGWVVLGAKYGITKGAAQKLYKESGNDPHASYIGRGGRYYGHADKIEELKESAKPAAKKAAAKAPRKGRSSAPTDAQFFTDLEIDKDEVVAAIEGKFIHHRMSNGEVAKTKVTPGSIKVGKQKDGTRVAQFNDGDKSRTVALASIAKVTAR